MIFKGAKKALKKPLCKMSTLETATATSVKLRSECPGSQGEKENMEIRDIQHVREGGFQSQGLTFVDMLTAAAGGRRKLRQHLGTRCTGFSRCLMANSGTYC